MIFVTIIDDLDIFCNDSLVAKMTEIRQDKEYSLHVNDYVLYVLCTGREKSISLKSEQNVVHLSKPFESSEIDFTNQPCYFIIYHLGQEEKEFTINGQEPSATNTLNELFMGEWKYLPEFPGFAVFDSRHEPIIKLLQVFEIVHNIDQLHERWKHTKND